MPSAGKQVSPFATDLPDEQCTLIYVEEGSTLEGFEGVDGDVCVDLNM